MIGHTLLYWVFTVEPIWSFSTTTGCWSRPTNKFAADSRLQLNRFLFDYSEVHFDDEDGDATPTVTLNADDYRTVHAAKTLGLHNNDTIRAGIVSSDGMKGQLTDDAVVEWLPEGKVKKPEPLAKSGKPPGSLRLRLDNLQQVSESDISSTSEAVSLILALPRPLQLNRLLPMISQMGIEHLVLTGASKVPKDYFGSHLFRKPQQLRDRLVEGLCQCGDVQLPKLHISKQLRHLEQINKEDETSLLDTLFPLSEFARVIAHPQRSGDVDFPQPIRMDDVQFPSTATKKKIVLAVGPEGGWTEPNELDWFMYNGFQHVTLGPRVLRSDCAVVSLLALAHFVTDAHSEE